MNKKLSGRPKAGLKCAGVSSHQLPNLPWDKPYLIQRTEYAKKRHECLAIDNYTNHLHLGMSLRETQERKTIDNAMGLRPWLRPQRKLAFAPPIMPSIMFPCPDKRHLVMVEIRSG